MRMLLLSLLTAFTAAIATPASAQWYPQGYGYGHGYGYARSLDARVDRLQYQIRRLDRYNVISNREARRLRQHSNEIEYRIRRAARNGLSPNEIYSLERRLAHLERRIAVAANYSYRDRRYGWNDRRHWDHDRRWNDRRYERRGRDRERDDDDDDDD